MSRYVPWVVGLIWLTAFVLASVLTIGMLHDYITEAF